MNTPFLLHRLRKSCYPRKQVRRIPFAVVCPAFVRAHKRMAIYCTSMPECILFFSAIFLRRAGDCGTAAYWKLRMAAVLTPADSNNWRTCASWFHSNRKAMPQSLENWRGVGTSFTVNPLFRSIFSERNAAELVWKRTIPADTRAPSAAVNWKIPANSQSLPPHLSRHKYRRQLSKCPRQIEPCLPETFRSCGARQARNANRHGS